MKKKKVSYRHIVVATMDLRLLLFLIKKGVLTKFLDNCEESSASCCVSTLHFITKVFNHTTLRKKTIEFEDYFLWSRTSQGWKYWNNLYNEFCTNEYT